MAKSSPTPSTADPVTSAADMVQPFQIERSGLRGRMVRLGPALDRILAQHDYPEAVSVLLAETAALGVLLASALKYDGVFTLQASGDGPVSILVADVTTDGALRAYAKFDAEAVPKQGALGDLIGKGHLAFTVDQGDFTDRYQGIVALTGDTLAECVQHYFRQSEQIDAGIALAVQRTGGSWRAGGLSIQRLPDVERQVPASDREDDWRRAMILMNSATDAELLDPALAPNALLYRLFHEDGVRVYDPVPIRAACRCARERVERVLAALPRDEVTDLKEDGAVRVTCEFCNTEYKFDDAALALLYGDS